MVSADIDEVIVAAIPLIFTGLAITFAYRYVLYTGHIGVGKIAIENIRADWPRSPKLTKRNRKSLEFI